MKNKIYKLSVIIFFVGILLSCSKTKRYSKRLDANKWQVKEITIDGVAESNLPEILFKECDVYNESCEGSWITPEGGRSSFIWQFRNNGKEFEISNQTDHVHNFQDVKAAEQCINYSGVYKVIDSKRKLLYIETTNSFGHKGKVVKITFEK